MIIANAQGLHLSNQTDHHILSLEYEQLAAHYDPIFRALWCTLKAEPRPVLTLTLLNNIRSLQNSVAQYCMENPRKKPKYIIWQSNNENIFNLGADLQHIYEHINSGNAKELESYIQLCIDAFYINLMKLDIHPLVSISLIRGKAYGGGLEAALTSDVIVCENNAKVCFPEIRYNLLPSVGTLRMLLQQYSPKIVEPLIFEGKQLNLQKSHELGLVDHVVKQGHGQSFIRGLIKKIHKRHALIASIYKAKAKHHLITYKDLEDFKEEWVRAALALKPKNIRHLYRLASAQQNIVRRLIE